jgi:DNA-directed RNA polymerase alpha subunit
MKRVVLVTTEQGRDVLKAAGIKFDALVLPDPEPVRAPGMLDGKSSIEKLELPISLFNNLKQCHITTIEDLYVAQRGGLIKLPRISNRKVDIINEALEAFGLKVLP